MSKKRKCKKGWSPAREITPCFRGRDLCVPDMPADSPESALEAFKKIARTDPGTFLSVELFIVLWKDVRNRVLSYTSQVGGCAFTAVDPCGIVRDGVLAGAKTAVLIHNHPSGTADSSVQDVNITRKIGKSLKTVGIELQDHVVVSFDMTPAGIIRGDWFSLRQEGRVDFTEFSIRLP